jgi:hypothetical protein
MSRLALENTPGVGDVGGVISVKPHVCSSARDKQEICLKELLRGVVDNGVSFETVTGYGKDSAVQVVRIAGRRLRADAFDFKNAPYRAPSCG